MHRHMWRLSRIASGLFDYIFTCTCGRRRRVVKSRFWDGTAQSQIQSKLVFASLIGWPANTNSRRTT